MTRWVLLAFNDFAFLKKKDSRRNFDALMQSLEILIISEATFQVCLLSLVYLTTLLELSSFLPRKIYLDTSILIYYIVYCFTLNQNDNTIQTKNNNNKLTIKMLKTDICILYIGTLQLI